MVKPPSQLETLTRPKDVDDNVGKGRQRSPHDLSLAEMVTAHSGILTRLAGSWESSTY